MLEPRQSRVKVLRAACIYRLHIFVQHKNTFHTEIIFYQLTVCVSSLPTGYMQLACPRLQANKQRNTNVNILYRYRPTKLQDARLKYQEEQCSLANRREEGKGRRTTQLEQNEPNGKATQHLPLRVMESRQSEKVPPR